MRPPSPGVGRVFLACAPSDLKYAELIIAKSRHDRLRVEFDLFNDGRPTDVSWQLECRRRIRASGALVLLLSPRTRGSPRAMWQVQCARQHGIAVVAISIAFGGETGDLCDIELSGDSFVGWKWRAIAGTLVRLANAGEKTALGTSHASPDGGAGV